MNYRHAYHAGNHADVLKHITLSRVLSYVLQKDKPFAALDAHAGLGLYDLKSLEAGKTEEWQGGIAKLLGAPFAEDAQQLLQPYLDAIAKLNPNNELSKYPGSPEIIAQYLRGGDRLMLNELHPKDFETLSARYRRNKNVAVSQLDAAIAVRAALPFKERRGIVLLDPAFEVKDEMDRVGRMISDIFQRMATTIVLVWYPIKTLDDADLLRQRMSDFKQPGSLVAELLVKEPFAEGGLAGSAMAIFNPPYILANELRTILPVLAQRLGIGNWGRGNLYELSPPK